MAVAVAVAFDTEAAVGTAAVEEEEPDCRTLLSWFVGCMIQDGGIVVAYRIELEAGVAFPQVVQGNVDEALQREAKNVAEEEHWEVPANAASLAPEALDDAVLVQVPLHPKLSSRLDSSAFPGHSALPSYVHKN